MLYVNVNSIFFKSYSVDPISGHVIYVFDSTYLPSPEEIGDKQVYDLLIDELMEKLVKKLPGGPFSLVVFSSGFSQKKISWVYGIKMFAKIPKEIRCQLQKTYIVHESFFIRTVYQVLSNAMNLKLLHKNPLQESNNHFASTDTYPNQSMVHLSSLTELAQLIDITRLRISLNVYMHDYQFNDYIDLPQQYFTRLSSANVKQYRQLVFDKVFKRLEIEGPENELVFQKPGSYKKVNILLDIIERNNYIDLSQWDIHSLATVFLHFLRNKSSPLIPIDLISLPIKDDYQYTYTTFCNIVKSNQYFDLLETIFPLFLSILENSDTTSHTVKTLSKSLTPTLCQEKVSMMNSDRLAVGTRFIGNLLEHFTAIVERIDRARKSSEKSLIKQVAKTPNKSQIMNQELEGANLRLISATITEATSSAPPLPTPRKTSPTRYGDLGDNVSKRQKSPSRATSQNSPDPHSIRSTSSTSTLLGENSSIPLLRPREKTVPPIRVQSDSAATLADNSESVSSRSPSSSNSSESISQMVTEDADKDIVEIDQESHDIAQYSLTEESKLQIDDKFIQFDRNLVRKKLMNEKAGKDTKFSTEGYSEIKVGNKVGKLAALYEERLQGLQAINDLKKSSAFS